MSNFLLRLLIRCYFPFVGVLIALSLGGTVVLIVVLIQSELWYLSIPALILTIAGLHMIYVLYFVLTFEVPKDFMEMRFKREKLEALYTMAEGVAEQWELEPPDEIRLGAGTVAHVYESDKGKRILVIGGVAVAAFSQETLAGVVAHELAHFTAGDTGLAKKAFRRRLTMDAFQYMCHTAKITYANPLVWLALLYQGVFRLLDASQSRKQEYAADEYSVRQAGAEAASTSLIYLCVTEHLRWANLSKIIDAAVKAEQVLVPIFAQQVEMARDTDVAEWNKALKKALMDMTGFLDSHPCLHDRLAAMGIKPKRALKIALEQRGTPASELIPSWESIEKDLSERLLEPFRARRAAMLDAYRVMKTIDQIHGAGGSSGF